jgi:hypothetical protein
VTHRSEDYVVLIADASKESRIFSISESYEVPDGGISRVLTDAAVRGIKIELEIEITAGGEKTVVAIKIPPTTTL